jgi:hypothetical protein
MEGQLLSNLAAMRNLDEISRRDNVAVFGAQLEETVNGSPGIANGHGVCLSGRMPRAEYEDNKRQQLKAMRRDGFHAPSSVSLD